ncbi:uncharacterized protein CcaverHIS019_0606860 [Cutaneotrichosporon cavernicola]|uniref:Uncharacterized protein n=1 Tax=Cutaneotrichosporon cavernicola TaxID=279322 RepID=A0AA48L927_9TREE|nr:uncharacterized protein CcaverHIS019_0606860 [Cutaneotrichosporon cavernicola]BEI94227.1 hypothetical protein CcaverHIS019_0606860 [Cutaneotrichosporon cavernicola]BEJ02007.1 hypothetical protein CcaverHIS631_0606890 [Cutaneotrichosporon cavernicola]BEJ09770.1 hypothetical protein CcaverHIS641_0606850 [Cutaneotrichosporon cavernicola]
MGWPSSARSTAGSSPASPHPPPPYHEKNATEGKGPASTPKSPTGPTHIPIRASTDTLHRTATLPPPPPPGSFAAILLDNGQQITSLRLPKRLVGPLSAAITSAWPDGLLRCAASPVQGGWEWELNGWPFVQHVESRRIMFAILQVLYAAGWAVQCSNNINKHHMAKGTIFLKAGEPCGKTFFGISFFKEDRIRLIDAPTAELRATFIAIAKTWHKGVQEAKEKWAGCVQVKFRGTPFYTNDHMEQDMIRMLLLDIMTAFDALGFELVTCIEMADFVRHEGTQPETWFFANKNRQREGSVRSSICHGS